METKLIIRIVGVLHLLIGVITFTLINVLPSASVMAPTFPNPILDDPSGQVVANIQPAVHGVAGLNIGLGLLFLIASNILIGHPGDFFYWAFSFDLLWNHNSLNQWSIRSYFTTSTLWIILIAADAFSFLEYKKG